MVYRSVGEVEYSIPVALVLWGALDLTSVSALTIASVNLFAFRNAMAKLLASLRALKVDEAT
jgi:hypothetical protein